MFRARVWRVGGNRVPRVLAGGVRAWHATMSCAWCSQTVARNKNGKPRLQAQTALQARSR